MSRTLAPAALALLGLILAGCPTPPRRPSPDAGSQPLEYVGLSCNVDAECGPVRCDKIRRQCICLSDETCRSTDLAAAPKYCNNYTGLCVEEIAGCKSDAECSGAEYCDKSLRACRPFKNFCESCGADNECGGTGDRCLTAADGSRFCSRTCATHADCARGAQCRDTDGTRQCWPNTNPIAPTESATCADFRGCTPDSLRTCSSDAECLELGDQRCDSNQGKCVAIQQVCPFGTACDPRNKICVTECTADADCGDPALRCVNRVCEPASECQSDLDCPANKVCAIPPGQTTGACHPFCQSDGQCPLGQTCQRSTDGRYRCVGGCLTHADCPLDQRCNASTSLCEGPAVGSARICQTSVACQTCEVCDAIKLECGSATALFPYCAPCTSATQCPGGACVGMLDGSYCARVCGGGEECPQGFSCLPIGGGSQSACVPADRRCQQKCS
jgi:hypothetical protein